LVRVLSASEPGIGSVERLLWKLPHLSDAREMFSEEDGRLAVHIARTIVECHVKHEKPPEFEVPDIFKKMSGVFVTLTTYPDDELRGCIGYPEPVMPLIDALQDAAVSAASRDPRFPPVNPQELRKIKVEVSLLTPPVEICVDRPLKLVDCVKVGEDGLIIHRNWAKGLLLPQVPIEWGWDSEEFLCQTCVKAGLTPDTWLQEGTKVFKFQAEVFSESKPGGEVRRRRLGEEHGSC
jgi:hypothetical protein